MSRPDSNKPSLSPNQLPLNDIRNPNGLPPREVQPETCVITDHAGSLLSLLEGLPPESADYVRRLYSQRNAVQIHPDRPESIHVIPTDGITDQVSLDKIRQLSGWVGRNTGVRFALAGRGEVSPKVPVHSYYSGAYIDSEHPVLGLNPQTALRLKDKHQSTVAVTSLAREGIIDPVSLPAIYIEVQPATVIDQHRTLSHQRDQLLDRITQGESGLESEVARLNTQICTITPGFYEAAMDRIASAIALKQAAHQSARGLEARGIAAGLTDAISESRPGAIFRPAFTDGGYGAYRIYQNEKGWTVVSDKDVQGSPRHMFSTPEAAVTFAQTYLYYPSDTVVTTRLCGVDSSPSTSNYVSRTSDGQLEIHSAVNAQTIGSTGGCIGGTSAHLTDPQTRAQIALHEPRLLANSRTLIEQMVRPSDITGTIHLGFDWIILNASERAMQQVAQHDPHFAHRYGSELADGVAWVECNPRLTDLSLNSAAGVAISRHRHGQGLGPITAKELAAVHESGFAVFDFLHIPDGFTMDNLFQWLDAFNSQYADKGIYAIPRIHTDAKKAVSIVGYIDPQISEHLKRSNPQALKEIQRLFKLVMWGLERSEELLGANDVLKTPAGQKPNLKLEEKCESMARKENRKDLLPPNGANGSPAPRHPNGTGPYGGLGGGPAEHHFHLPGGEYPTGPISTDVDTHRGTNSLAGLTVADYSSMPRSLLHQLYRTATPDTQAEIAEALRLRSQDGPTSSKADLDVASADRKPNLTGAVRTAWESTASAREILGMAGQALVAVATGVVRAEVQALPRQLATAGFIAHEGLVLAKDAVGAGAGILADQITRHPRIAAELALTAAAALIAPEVGVPGILAANVAVGTLAAVRGYQAAEKVADFVGEVTGHDAAAAQQPRLTWSEYITANQIDKNQNRTAAAINRQHQAGVRAAARQQRIDDHIARQAERRKAAIVAAAKQAEQHRRRAADRASRNQVKKPDRTHSDQAIKPKSPVQPHAEHSVSPQHVNRSLAEAPVSSSETPPAHSNHYVTAPDYSSVPTESLATPPHQKPDRPISHRPFSDKPPRRFRLPIPTPDLDAAYDAAWNTDTPPKSQPEPQPAPTPASGATEGFMTSLTQPGPELPKPHSNLSPSAEVLARYWMALKDQAEEENSAGKDTTGTFEMMRKLTEVADQKASRATIAQVRHGARTNS